MFGSLGGWEVGFFDFLSLHFRRERTGFFQPLYRAKAEGTNTVPGLFARRRHRPRSSGIVVPDALAFQKESFSARQLGLGILQNATKEILS